MPNGSAPFGTQIHCGESPHFCGALKPSHWLVFVALQSDVRLSLTFARDRQ